MKKIPKTNYIILGSIILITVVLVIYAGKWYKTYQEYYVNNSPMVSIAQKINLDEIYNYSIENPNFVIYISSGTDQINKKYEQLLKQYIVQNGLTSQLIYLNADTNSLEQINNTLKEKFSADILKEVENDAYPNMYVVENGKIKSVLTQTKETPSLNESKKFIKESFLND